jgi:phosphoribosylformimino-5-aminoimidazole carboxamide ribotide isomerase
MILFPAVDIKDGRCVRLKQGVQDQVTVFSPDPVAMALHWVEQGARWLHVVDLDGAFAGRPVNAELVGRICARAKVPVQLGGGVRSLEIADAYLKSGVQRLIIGTLALEDQETFTGLCRAFPGRVGVSLDARDGRLKTKGWVEDAGLTVADVVEGLEQAGCAFLVYTDIARDGMQAGVNISALQSLLEITSLPVLAAGGVSTLDDIKALAPLFMRGLEGVITGKAIYEGSLNLGEAQAWIDAM